MSNAGQHERATRNHLIEFFQQELGYRYLGNWEYRENNRNIEQRLLPDWRERRDLLNRMPLAHHHWHY